MTSRATADDLLLAARRLGLAPVADEKSASLWHAKCPLCALTSENKPLAIRETRRGKPAAVDCKNRCDGAEILKHLEAELTPGVDDENSPIRFLDVGAMVAKPPPPVAWLAPPVLPRASLTALYAPGGDGKSLLAAALACAIADGTEVAGIACETGTTIYLDGENGEHEIWRRVHTLGMPGEGVQMADASGFDLRRDLELLADLIHEHKPDLVVLDSFRSLTPGLDENDTKQTAAALDPLRRLAHESCSAVLLIHHANKAGKDFRGASSIRDSVDVLWAMGRHEGDADRCRRFLACRKMRVAAEPDRMWLRLEVDRGRVLVDQAAAPDDQMAVAERQPVRAALSDSILAAMNGAPHRLNEIAELVERGPKDGSLRNALSGLVAAGELSRDGAAYIKVQSGANGATQEIAPVAPKVQSADALKGDCTFAPAANALTADIFGDE